MFAPERTTTPSPSRAPKSRSNAARKAEGHGNGLRKNAHLQRIHKPSLIRPAPRSNPELLYRSRRSPAAGDCGSAVGGVAGDLTLLEGWHNLPDKGSQHLARLVGVHAVGINRVGDISLRNDVGPAMVAPVHDAVPAAAEVALEVRRGGDAVGHVPIHVVGLAHVHFAEAVGLGPLE